MGISITCLEKQKECVEFLGKLKIADNLLKLIGYSGSIYLILPLLGVVLQDYIKTQRLIRQIRHSLNSCKLSCNNTECLNLFYKMAKEIRDNYLNIYNRINQTKFHSFLLKRIIEKSLSDWDELAVDCLVGSDDEFRNLIFQIAENS